jgi:hypothetical protein
MTIFILLIFNPVLTYAVSPVYTEKNNLDTLSEVPKINNKTIPNNINNTNIIETTTGSAISIKSTKVSSDSVYSNQKHNLVSGASGNGIFESSQMRGVSIVDVSHPIYGMMKALRLDKDSNIPVVSSKELNIKINTPYVLEFDYWADVDNVKFNVDLWPDDLPEQHIISNKELRHFKWEFKSSSPNMNKAKLRFFNNIQTPNPSNIYITNIQLYESIYNVHNLVGGSSEIGIFNSGWGIGYTIIDTVHPTQGQIKAIRLDVGTDVPDIISSELNLKQNTLYTIEFDYWSDNDNVKFNVDLWPDDLPENYPIAKRTIQHFKQEIISTSPNMNKSLLRFFNTINIPNPSNIYITNIQLYESIYNLYNIVGGVEEVGIFDSGWGAGNSIVDVLHPTQGNVKAIRLDGGANVPYTNTYYQLNLKANTTYVVEFDYWSDTDDAIFEIDLFPDDLPQNFTKARKQVQHFKWEVNSSSVNMDKAKLRFFNDLVIPNPSNIYITNIQLYEKNGTISLYGYTGTTYLSDINNRLTYILKDGQTIIKYLYDNNGNLKTIQKYD